jgi:hypothetical protein
MTEWPAQRQPTPPITDDMVAAVTAAKTRGPRPGEVACTVCGRGIRTVFGITTHYDCHPKGIA